MGRRPPRPPDGKQQGDHRDSPRDQPSPRVPNAWRRDRHANGGGRSFADGVGGALERTRHQIDRLETLIGPKRERTFDDVGECPRNRRIERLRIGCVMGCSSQQPAHMIGSVERRLSGQQLEQQCTETVNVAARVTARTHELLRRHVLGCAVDLRRFPAALVGGLRLLACDAEVEHLHPPACCDHDIGWLQVTMDDCVRVRLRQRIGNLPRDRQRLLGRERPALDQCAERLSFHVLHDDVGKVVDVEHVVDGGNIGMIQLGGGKGFTPKPLARIGGRRAVVCALDRHAASEPRIFGQEHLSHAAGAKAREKAVRSNLLSVHLGWDVGRRIHGLGRHRNSQREGGRPDRACGACFMAA